MYCLGESSEGPGDFRPRPAGRPLEPRNQPANRPIPILATRQQMTIPAASDVNHPVGSKVCTRDVEFALVHRPRLEGYKRLSSTPPELLPLPSFSIRFALAYLTCLLHGFSGTSTGLDQNLAPLWPWRLRPFHALARREGTFFSFFPIR